MPNARTNARTNARNVAAKNGAPVIVKDAAPVTPAAPVADPRAAANAAHAERAANARNAALRLADGMSKDAPRARRLLSTVLAAIATDARREYRANNKKATHAEQLAAVLAVLKSDAAALADELRAAPALIADCVAVSGATIDGGFTAGDVAAAATGIVESASGIRSRLAARTPAAK